MTAKAIVWDGSFGDPSLPRVTLGFAPPLTNAIHDWAADDLPVGPLASWSSVTSGTNLSTAQGSPRVVTSGGGKAVLFDGVSDRMRSPFVITGPRTFVVVYRFTSVTPSAVVTYGYSSAVGGAITTDDAMSFIGGTIGTQYLIPSPRLAPDTSWHIALLSVNGSESAFRQDRGEIVGTAAVNNTDGIALGFGSGDTKSTPIEYKRVAVLAGGTTGAQRDAIVNQLAGRYGISF